MLSDEDIKKLTKAQIEAQKEVFFTKKELDERFYSKADMDERFYSKTDMDMKFFNLRDVFATKEEMNVGFEKLDKKMTNLQTSIDAIAKDNLTKSQETPVLNHRIKEVENWVDKAAPKLGIKFVH